MADNSATAYDPENIFAKLLKGEIPCQKCFEDDDTLAFLEIMPRTEGHALLMTKEPAADLFAITPEGLGKLMTVVQTLAPKIKQAVGADGVLIQQFNGAAAGQTVFHLHVHIVPRKADVPMRPEAAKMAEPDELKATAKKIRAVLGA